MLDLATRYAPDSCLSLGSVHRFTDLAYADLSLRMRRGESAGAVFDVLLARGEIVIHPTEVGQLTTLAADGSRADGPLVIADTREQVAKINALIHDIRVDTDHLLVDEHTGASSAYVAMTRSRRPDTAHLVRRLR